MCFNHLLMFSVKDTLGILETANLQFFWTHYYETCHGECSLAKLCPNSFPAGRSSMFGLKSTTWAGCPDLMHVQFKLNLKPQWLPIWHGICFSHLHVIWNVVLWHVLHVMQAILCNSLGHTLLAGVLSQAAFGGWSLNMKSPQMGKPANTPKFLEVEDMLVLLWLYRTQSNILKWLEAPPATKRLMLRWLGLLLRHFAVFSCARMLCCILILPFWLSKVPNLEAWGWWKQPFWRRPLSSRLVSVFIEKSSAALKPEEDQLIKLLMRSGSDPCWL